MGWRVADFGLCKPLHFWSALRGLIQAKNERYEFAYNLARMETTALLNIQLKMEDRITPSELWPDWISNHEVETESDDPELIIERNRRAIEFLNSK